MAEMGESSNNGEVGGGGNCSDEGDDGGDSKDEEDAIYERQMEEDYLVHASALGLNHIRTCSVPSPLRAVSSIATSNLGASSSNINNDKTVAQPQGEVNTKQIFKSTDPG